MNRHYGPPERSVCDANDVTRMYTLALWSGASTSCCVCVFITNRKVSEHRPLHQCLPCVFTSVFPVSSPVSSLCTGGSGGARRVRTAAAAQAAPYVRGAVGAPAAHRQQRPRLRRRPRRQRRPVQAAAGHVRRAHHGAAAGGGHGIGCKWDGCSWRRLGGGQSGRCGGHGCRRRRQ